MVSATRLCFSLALTALGLVSTASANSCNSSALNTTQTTYTTDAIVTVATVAESYNRGVCDVARANRMSDPTIPFAVDTVVIIPAEVCEPDNDSCFTVVDNDTTNFCLMGGPHLYYTQRNDTYRTIALERFNITLASVLDALSVDESDADTVLDAGLFIKIPSCYPSQCTLQPYKFTYGTYKDLAELFGASVGQIIAYNPTYSHSSSLVADDGPVLTIPMDCKALADTVTSMT
ncbi:hypothetical protein BBJ28_00012283 [Nothophytophthora sp. Chile5]|nr:hypothetical protein BBJ28_00012283 [Nothophytophthora sp. Chile5]